MQVDSHTCVVGVTASQQLGELSRVEERILQAVNQVDKTSYYSC